MVLYTYAYNKIRRIPATPACAYIDGRRADGSVIIIVVRPRELVTHVDEEMTIIYYIDCRSVRNNVIYLYLSIFYCYLLN